MTIWVNRKDWHFNLPRVKITYFLHTSKISNCKEWSFTLQRVKFQSFKSEIFDQCFLSTISLDWSVLKFNKHKRESLETDRTEGTPYEKIENFILKGLKFHSLQSENSLFTVWNFTRMGENKFSLFVDWNFNLFDWSYKSLSKEDWIFHYLEFREYD